jgi:NAD(P)-dependent dehydrogenase (short-subunit alcohol dehydrogenase family)
MGQLELASPVGDGMRSMVAMSGTGRVGTPDDIAAATAFLLGPDATFITGTDLLVDGGVVAAAKAGNPGS